METTKLLLPTEVLIFIPSVMPSSPAGTVPGYRMEESLPLEDTILYNPTAAAKESAPSTTDGTIAPFRAFSNIFLIFVSKTNSAIYKENFLRDRRLYNR